MTTIITCSCFCKAIQYQITSAIPLAINCQDNGCQKATAKTRWPG